MFFIVKMKILNVFRILQKFFKELFPDRFIGEPKMYSVVSLWNPLLCLRVYDLLNEI